MPYVREITRKKKMVKGSSSGAVTKPRSITKSKAVTKSKSTGGPPKPTASKGTSVSRTVKVSKPKQFTPMKRGRLKAMKRNEAFRKAGKTEALKKARIRAKRRRLKRSGRA